MKTNTMNNLFRNSILVLAFTFQLSTLFGQKKSEQVFSFDKYKIGALPTEWQSFSAISSAGKNIECAPTTAVKFEVVNEPESKNNVIALSEHINSIYDHGHVAYPSKIKIQNGSVSASIQATDSVKGHGGLAVRIVDYKNYYGIRYSFIEGNVMIIKVKNGVASNLKKAPALDIKGRNKWVKMTVELNENELVVLLDDKEIIRTVDADPLLAEGYAGFFSRGEKSLILGIASQLRQNRYS